MRDLYELMLEVAKKKREKLKALPPAPNNQKRPQKSSKNRK